MNSILIKNADAVLIGSVSRRDIRIKNGIITEIAGCITPEDGESVLDIGDAYLMPGFIDTHMHGAFGQVFTRDSQDLDKITSYEVKKGVTAVTPSLSTMAEEDFMVCARNVLECMERGPVGSRLLGIHAEGPFLNYERKGGMRAQYIRDPDVEEFYRMNEVCRGQLKIITVAPELPGAAKLIRAAYDAGLAVSAGHTSATYDEMLRAIDAGVTRMTHTFNAARPINHREPGVLGAALTDDRVNCEVICDFAHLHPAAVEMIYRLKGSHGFTAISDSEFCAGLPEGHISFGEYEIDHYGGVAHLPDGTICGSAGDLHMGVKNLYSLGIPMWEISEMVSANPAKALGMYDKLGSITLGKEADLTVLDRELSVKYTLIGGKIAYSA